MDDDFCSVCKTGRGREGEGLGLRDEVDLIMKRLRIPWREGGKEGEPERDRSREREREK